ncbi:MAG: dTDP-4-dehydrorhamnose reductase [Deltaproteobacteria bacterium]|nr:dTDP-4-dehydrorhamnose reductase [Deltaproteobacteria bacterium]
MRILITGACGQLGTDLSEVIGRSDQVWALGRNEFDLTRPEQIGDVLASIKPDVVVNCSAYTNVDDCQNRPAICRDINEQGTGRLARSAESLGCRLIHISTDYVFDGRRAVPEPYTEDDVPSPISVYGESKLRGEQLVQAYCTRFAILRTAWLYGIHGRNFLKTILRLALQHSENSIKVVDDQHGSPTWSRTLARQIRAVIENGAEGVFHATAEGHCTWYELTRAFLDRMGVRTRVAPCTTAEFPRPAPRPANSILENRRLKALDIHMMRSWETDLADFVERYSDRLLSEAQAELQRQ